MPEGSIIAVTTIVLVGVTAYLIGSLVRSIARERRSSNVRKIWKNFGLSLAFCGLFLVSWTAQAIAEWGSFRADRMEQKIDGIAKRLDELAGGKAPVVDADPYEPDSCTIRPGVPSNDVRNDARASQGPPWPRCRAGRGPGP
jgi:hypothetical protein